MNDSLYRDLGVLRKLTERWSKGSEILHAVWPVGLDHLAATNLTHTMVVRPSPRFPLDHPFSIEDLYRTLGQPELRKHSDREVLFHHFNSQKLLEVKWPGGSERLQALPVDAPALPQGAPYKRSCALSIPADSFEFVARAMCMDAVRYALCGILIDGQNRKIVASDGKRLHLRRFSSEKKFPSLVLSSEAVRPLLAAQEREGYAPIQKIGLPEGDPTEQFSLSAGRFTIYTKPVQGHFPNYAAILPESYHGQIRLDAHEWREALKSLKLFLKLNPSKDKKYPSRRVRLDTISKPGGLRVVGMAEGKEAERLVRIKGSGANLALFDGVSFNVDYLLDASWNDGETILQINSPENAMMVDGQAIIMPLAMGDGFETRAKAYAKELATKPAKFKPDENPDRTSTWKRKKTLPTHKEETVEPKPKPKPAPKVAKPLPKPRTVHRLSARRDPVARSPRPAAAPAAQPAAPKPAKRIREYDFNLFS